MDIEKVEIRKAKNAKADYLQNGVVGLTLKEFGMDLRNIPYRITKDKEIIVTPPGLIYAEQKDKGGKIENKLVPTFSFHDSSVWDAIVEAIKKEISATLE